MNSSSQVDDSAVSATQDEDVKTQFLLYEPKRKDFSLDGIFPSDTYSSTFNTLSSPKYDDAPMDKNVFRTNHRLLTANDLGSAGSSTSSSSTTKAVLKVKLEREEEYRETPWTNKITRRWTDTEVSNLVEGVSQFGTKRWPDIKKMQFWSDSPRKPGDLRKKWTSLVVACKRAQEQNELAGQKTKQAKGLKLPDDLVERILDVASVQNNDS